MESLSNVESIQGMVGSNVEGGMLNVLLCLLNEKNYQQTLPKMCLITLSGFEFFGS